MTTRRVRCSASPVSLLCGRTVPAIPPRGAFLRLEIRGRLGIPRHRLQSGLLQTGAAFSLRIGRPGTGEVAHPTSSPRGSSLCNPRRVV